MSSVKEFIAQFDDHNPDWSQAPEGFPHCDLAGLSSSEVGTFLRTKTVWELSRPERPPQRSRGWQDPEGYRYLVQWSNTVLLRYLVRLETDALPKSEYRRKAQVDDAARSTVRNIEEGYKRATTREYLDFIGYSQGSLEEVRGDVRELTEDGLLASRPESSLGKIGIDLGELHRALQGSKGQHRTAEATDGAKGDYRGIEEDREGSGAQKRTGSGRTVRCFEKDFSYRPLTILYPPFTKITANDLSYEIFFELINKTDWLLRKLVASLEKKLDGEQKWYQIEQARIRDKFRKK